MVSKRTLYIDHLNDIMKHQMYFMVLFNPLQVESILLNISMKKLNLSHLVTVCINVLNMIPEKKLVAVCFFPHSNRRNVLQKKRLVS